MRKMGIILIWTTTKVNIYLYSTYKLRDKMFLHSARQVRFQFSFILSFFFPDWTLKSLNTWAWTLTKEESKRFKFFFRSFPFFFLPLHSLKMHSNVSSLVSQTKKNLLEATTIFPFSQSLHNEIRDEHDEILILPMPERTSITYLCTWIGFRMKCAEEEPRCIEFEVLSQPEGETGKSGKKKDLWKGRESRIESNLRFYSTPCTLGLIRPDLMAS